MHKYNTWFPDPSTTDPENGFDVLASERLKILQSIIGHLGDDEVFIEARDWLRGLLTAEPEVDDD